MQTMRQAPWSQKCKARSSCNRSSGCLLLTTSSCSIGQYRCYDSSPFEDSLHSILHTSLQALTIDELIEMAHHAAASRVLDVLLSSPTVPAKAKRTFVLGFMGRWHELVDDRIGSRVGERCWAAADGYMKVCLFSPSGACLWVCC